MKPLRSWPPIGPALLTLGLLACRPSPGELATRRIDAATVTKDSLSVTQPYALEPIGPGPVPVYFRLYNHGRIPDTLVGVSSDRAAMVGLHGEGMVAIGSLPLPGNDSVVLAPTARHVMLDSLTRAVVAGDSVIITLNFARAGGVRVTVPVISYREFDQLRAPIRIPPR